MNLCINTTCVNTEVHEPGIRSGGTFRGKCCVYCALV